MCGILGFNGAFNSAFLRAGLNVIAHRGPDDSGVFKDEQVGVGLGHVRLSILDLSSLGHQPMMCADKSVVIVFNGEIYNFQELRKELEAKGHPFLGHSDTEVLLNLYLSEGVAMLSRLNGIFAFAMWDSRNKSLFIARDGLGIKPFYYAETTKGFLFASELKALLLEPSISCELDLSALNNYLRFLWCPAPRTPLKNVFKLEPGHALIVKDGEIKKKWQFYDLPYDQPILSIDEQSAIQSVSDAVQLSVQRQMVADVEVGAFLSGGLDSSAVIAFAKDHAKGNKLKCFTIGFKDDAFIKEGMVDDLAYARQVAGHLDVDLHTIFVGAEMVGQLEKMLYHLDEPQADPAPINVLFISQLARDHGIKVLLSGAGGDDIFSGYRRHYALQLEKYWSWLPKNLRSALKNATQGLPKASPVGRRLAKAFQYADLDGNERIASYFSWNTPDVLKSLYSEDFQQGLNKDMSLDPLLASLRNLPAGTPALNRMLYLEGKHFLADHNLNYTDKMSMATGVEVRVPLLDPDLVALAARLPVEYKQRGREGKWIFKKAMEPYLPRNVIYRPKTGFGAPLRSWLRNELRPVVEDILSAQSLTNRGLFDPKGVRLLLEHDKQGIIDGTYTIFSLICIELWCRIFIDKPITAFSNTYQ